MNWLLAGRVWCEWMVVGAFINAAYILFSMWRGYLR